MELQSNQSGYSTAVQSRVLCLSESSGQWNDQTVSQLLKDSLGMQSASSRSSQEAGPSISEFAQLKCWRQKDLKKTQNTG